MNTSSKPTSADHSAEPLAAGNIPMPRLSDDAVVQIHDFIHHVLDLFEARYGDQLRRFYEDLCGDCVIEPDAEQTGANPLF
jgi:hypothetical protein